MIPAEAIEAALNHQRGSSRDHTPRMRREMLKLLEAAAPFIAAKAWQQGMEYSLSLLNGEELAASFRKDNPYRAAAVRGEG